MCWGKQGSQLSRGWRRPENRVKKACVPQLSTKQVTFWAAAAADFSSIQGIDDNDTLKAFTISAQKKSTLERIHRR